MTIKQLFKQMEKTNDFLTMISENETYIAEYAIDNDWYFSKITLNYKDFESTTKKEYTKTFFESMMNVELERQENGNLAGDFTIKYWWKETEETHTIEFCIRKN